MGKRNIDIKKETQHSFFNQKSYSVDEILAAGGTTAFANKLGKKSFAEMIEGLKQFPKDAFLTEEEYQEAIKTLKESK
ncbi:MAG TPA: hypothetical protein VIM55_08120 [Mucilaginibacter sp.]